MEEASGRRGRKGRSGFGGVSKVKRSKDYTAPVNFVAGGIQQSGKKKPVDDGKDDHPITDEEDDLETRPGFGSGAAIIDNDDSPNSSNESTEEEQIKNSQTKPMAKPSYRSNLKVGAWEQHTRGIGAKLLLQMGYEPGKGLGKDLQGISQPVEAHVRKGRGAIGAYGPETSASVTGKAQLDEDIRDAKEFKEKLNKWKKTDSRSEKNSKKYYYKTVEEVLEKGKRSNFMLGDKIRYNFDFNFYAHHPPDNNSYSVHNIQKFVINLKRKTSKYLLNLSLPCESKFDYDPNPRTTSSI